MFNALRILLGWSGRIGRRTWLAGLAFLVFFYPTLVALAMTSASGPREATRVMAGAALLGLWSVLALSAKRLRDMGRSPLWALAPIAPVALMMRMPPYAAIALRRGEFEAFGAVFVSHDPLVGAALLLQGALALLLLLGGPSPRAQGGRLAFAGARRAAGHASPSRSPGGSPWGSTSGAPGGAPWGAPWGAPSGETSPPPATPSSTSRPPPPSAPPSPPTRGSGLPRRDGPVIDRRR